MYTDGLALLAPISYQQTVRLWIRIIRAPRLCSAAELRAGTSLARAVWSMRKDGMEDEHDCSHASSSE